MDSMGCSPIIGASKTSRATESYNGLRSPCSRISDDNLLQLCSGPALPSEASFVIWLVLFAFFVQRR